MSLGNLDDIMKDESKLANLDWLDVKPGEYDNIPTNNPIEIIPQLSNVWNHHRDRTINIIPNQVLPGAHNETVVGPEKIIDVVQTAKKAMMSGVTGKELSSKLASLYTLTELESAKPELTKLADEQGLLGNVYIDLTPFDTCKDAAKTLGTHRVRLAKYAVGKPRKQIAYVDDEGYCLDLKKKVVEAVDYNKDLFDEYTDHLRIAGILEREESITSKESLREALLKKNRFTSDPSPVIVKEAKKVDIKAAEKSLSVISKKNREAEEQKINELRYHELKPILAYIQDEMLRGKIGNDLKESISRKFTPDIIQKYSSEIKKVAGLQGLLGNVYVDVSFYDGPDSAVRAIKNAATKPTYVVYASKVDAFDDTLEKVVKATGCIPLPRDGKIDKNIAASYIEDLKFNDRISSDLAKTLINKLSDNSDTLKIIQESFLRSASYVKKPKVGGVRASENKNYGFSIPSNDNLKLAATKALEKGVTYKDVEARVARSVKASEAIGIMKLALQSMSVVKAGIINNCQIVRYAFKQDAVLEKADKCVGCTFNNGMSCAKQKISFNDVVDPNSLIVDTALLEKGIRTANKKDDFSLDGEMHVDIDSPSDFESMDISGLINREGLDQGFAE